MDHSPLGALSPELRNRIYELALYERRPVSISKNFWAEAALLRTCKQVRQEAELLFYSINDFIFFTDLKDDNDPPRLHHWLQHGPRKKLALIKSLNIHVEVPGRGLAWHCTRHAHLSPEDKMCSLLRVHSFGDRHIAQVVKVSVRGFRDERVVDIYPASPEVAEEEEEQATKVMTLLFQICMPYGLDGGTFDVDEALSEVQKLRRSVDCKD